MLRGLYDYVSRLASHPRAELALFIVAFVESSFFPIPPDVLLIPMVIVCFEKAFRYAFICTLGSVLGGIAGYGIGYFLFDSIGQDIVDFYGVEDKLETFKEWYNQNSVYIVGLAGITPIPYKIATIASGMLHANFAAFVGVSIVSRAIRFYLIAWLLWRGGPALKGWIEKNLYPITMIVGIVFILLIVFLKIIFE